MNAPQSVLDFLAAVQLQTEISTSLAVAAIAAIILIWTRILGIYSDANFSSFQRPLLLIVPIVLLLISVIMSYFIGALISGYHAEIVYVVDSSSNTKIVSALDHFTSQYIEMFQIVGGIQLFCSVIGTLILVLWFVINVFTNLKRKI